MRRHHFIVLALAALLAVVLAVWTGPGQNPETPADAGGALAPELSGRINAVDGIVLRDHAGTLTLARVNGVWVLRERQDHPASPDQVTGLLRNLAHLTRIETRTRNPERHAQLGVDDPSQNESRALEIALKAGAQTLTTFVIGDRGPAKGDRRLDEINVRVDDDPQVWLVEGILPHRGTDPRDWISTTLLELGRDRVRALRVRHAGGASFTVRRDEPGATTWVLDPSPAGRETLPYRVNQVGNGVGRIEIVDVAPQTPDATGDAGGHVAKGQVEIETFDGLTATLALGQRDGKWWTTIDARYAAPATPPPANPALKDASVVEAEAREIHDRRQGWLYELPPYLVEDSLLPPLADLLAPLPDQKKK